MSNDHNVYSPKQGISLTIITTYKTATGTITTITNGVFMTITIIVAIRVDSEITKKLQIRGNLSSNISISPENRFIIRPVGVVSKNDIGDRRMLLKTFE